MISELEHMKMFAESAHINQLYDTHPYMLHLQQVADLLSDAGFGDLIGLGYLHDTLEDSQDKMIHDKLLIEFGNSVYDIVLLMTDNKRLKTRKERKEESMARLKKEKILWPALIVKSADRVANMQYSIRSNNLKKKEMYGNENREFINSVYRQFLNNPFIETLENLEHYFLHR